MGHYKGYKAVVEYAGLYCIDGICQLPEAEEAVEEEPVEEETVQDDPFNGF